MVEKQLYAPCVSLHLVHSSDLTCRDERSRVLHVFFKQKTADELRISDWRSDVCSSDLASGMCTVLEIASMEKEVRYQDPQDTANPQDSDQPLWERACSRWRRHSQYRYRL